MPYGTNWRQHRRTFHQFMNPNEVPRYRPIVEMEVYNFLRRVYERPKNFLEDARFLCGVVIMRVSYGMQDFEYNRRVVKLADEFVRGFSEYVAPGRLLVGALPWMRHIPSWLPGAGWKRSLERIRIAGDDVVGKPYADVKSEVRSGQTVEHSSLARSLVEALPDETSPEIQRNAQREIDSVIGRDRLPTSTDIERLPYIQAIVKEDGRWHSVLPLCLPHASKADDVYEGHLIPGGSVILSNTWAIMHDPEVFEEPMEFRPERYLSEIVTLVVPSLLAVFDVKPAKDAGGNVAPLKLEADPESVLVITPIPYECDIVLRSQHHATLIQE
ncbi:O-methylsterigmatocystin oxidoreductase [Coprinopsis cinerea AmutBmut pab1-1]|nr:O-methylsterigmatocystin oxidoreductase [Coprinopsis cinerea AmutBmut pab1-1]